MPLVNLKEIELFFCVHCRARMQLAIVGSKRIEAPADSDNSPYEDFFGTCIKCDSPAILRRGILPSGAYEHFATQVFPPETLVDRIDFVVPEDVKESYLEAQKCLAAQAWNATAVMVRRSLEAIAKDIDPKTKSLHAGLQKLNEKGIISAELKEWGDLLKFIGNTGAHSSLHRITRQDAEDALEFAGAIIETIYHLRPKFQKALRRKPTTPSQDNESSS